MQRTGVTRIRNTEGSVAIGKERAYFHLMPNVRGGQSLSRGER